MGAISFFFLLLPCHSPEVYLNQVGDKHIEKGVELMFLLKYIYLNTN